MTTDQARKPPDSRSRARVGGKAHALRLLDEAGIPVPRWEVLGTDLFDLAVASLRQDSYSPDRTAAALLEAPLPEAVKDAILKAYDRVGRSPISVRSSATVEDSAPASFAGIFTTQLNVRTAAEVVQAVRRCWASAFAAEVTAYQRGRHQDTTDAGAYAGGAEVKMAVILQAMVTPDSSGVLFTRDTVHGNSGAAMVSAVYGLGEGLVSGALDADTFVVDRESFDIVRAELGDKDQRVMPLAGAAGTGLVAVPAAQAAAPAVSAAQLSDLVRRGLEVERLFGAPQDVEWAISGGQLWILQSRPISGAHQAERSAGDSGLRIWDNSNIVESFGGISSPLTFTMANYIYGRVYIEYYRLLGVPRKDLDVAAGWMRNMLGYMHGRIYYNLLNWYKMLRALPLYGPNRRLFEIGLGVEESLDDETARAITAFDGRGTLMRLLLRMRVAIRFAGLWLRSARHVQNFLADFYRAFTRFDDIDYGAMGAAAIYRHFLDFEREILSKWGRMLALETIIGLTYVPLRTLTRAWVPDAPEWFAWEVAKPPDGIESLEPATALDALADMARQSPLALAVIARGGGLTELRAAAEAPFLAAFDSYLARFGYRSASELKLEAPTLAEQPAPLLESLRVRIADRARTDAKPAQSGIDVDQLLRTSMGPLRRCLYGALRRKVQRSLAARERVRFCRTRAFGVVKSMMRGLGQALAADGILAGPDDIYLLRLDELRGLFDGTVLHGALRETAAARQRALARDADLTVPPRFMTTDFIYRSLDAELDQRDVAAANATGPGAAPPGSVLRGTPSSPGIVDAHALVTTTPRSCDGGILVAYSTDPSWVTALTSARGLVIERGSPLTHVAIIAREMNIPTVTKVPGITTKIQTGCRLRLDGAAGTIRVLSGPPDHAAK